MEDKTEPEASYKPTGAWNMKPTTVFPKSLASYWITPFQMHTLHTAKVRWRQTAHFIGDSRGIFEGIITVTDVRKQ